MLLKCIIFFGAISTVYGYSPFRQCENGAATPIKVQINDCIQEPCILHPGKSLNANITFDAPYDIEVMKTMVNVTIHPTELSFVVDKESCKHLMRGWCPLEVDERAIYNFKMKLPILTPPVTITLETLLLAEDRHGTVDVINCFETTCKIVYG